MTQRLKFTKVTQPAFIVLTSDEKGGSNHYHILNDIERLSELTGTIHIIVVVEGGIERARDLYERFIGPDTGIVTRSVESKKAYLSSFAYEDDCRILWQKSQK